MIQSRWQWLIEEQVPGIGGVYLKRYVLLRTPLFSIVIQRIDQSDPDEAYHCHMADRLVLVLSGSYLDHFPPSEFRRRVAWNVFRRPAEQLHKLRLSPGRRVWELVLTGTERRTWGLDNGSGWSPVYDPQLERA